MTDVVQAKEAAIAAETRIEAIFNGVLDRLHHLNSTLLQLHDAIKQSQPVASGAVCLELYRCGGGCNGCPHPRWLKYHWTEPKGTTPGALIGTNLDALGKDPVLVLARKEPFYKPTAALIRETKAVLAERSKLLAIIRQLKFALRSMDNDL